MCAKRRNAESGSPSGGTGSPPGGTGSPPGGIGKPASSRDATVSEKTGAPDPEQQDQAWRDFVDRSRRDPVSFETHLAAFNRIFAGRRPEDGPPVVWAPDEAVRQRSNLQASMAAAGMEDYADFHAWSVGDRPAFWTHTIERLGIVFTKPPEGILDLAGSVRSSASGVGNPRSMPRGGVRDPRWLPGAELNIVDSCFTADPRRPAVITPGPDGQPLVTTTYGELESLVNRLANGLCDRGLAPGKAIALYMPLNLECVIAYLAIIRAGSRAVSIADSFPAAEVRRRMAIAGAECVVTMDCYVRAGKAIPLYETVVEAGASTVIVVPSGAAPGAGVEPPAAGLEPPGAEPPDSAEPPGAAAAGFEPPGAEPPDSAASGPVPEPPDGAEPPDTSGAALPARLLRPGDIPWPDLLSSDDTFESATGDPYRTTNVLFSSGTTGAPKAVPWNHLTPIKAAMDGYYHQDIHGDDVTAWPTNIGWMMGPWLIYATLVNGACMALFPGAANTPEYPRFIRRAGVTMLGVIPSLVRTWRHGGATEGGATDGGATEGGAIDGDAADGVDWPSIRVFSSTGEPASRTDYLWLMSRAAYRAPVIEYLGGTEIGGGHLACTVLQPCSPATFTTANLGVDFVILDEAGKAVGEGETGELFLVPPALGMSQRLLNGDHDEVYYAGCPAGPEGTVLRRHGDNTQRLHCGCYRAQGRADDGMNLGGIKVSPLELERIVDGHPAVYESAAVAVQPEGEGAERLVVYIVPEGGSGAAGRHAASQTDPDTLKSELQSMVSAGLNPLFRIYRVVMVDELPHTASGKLVRRTLRDRMGP